jgi:hypothetical protein
LRIEAVAAFFLEREGERCLKLEILHPLYPSSHPRWVA